ncbi:hypothetical protein OAB63_02895 [Alphaproteobacteria bacterium]|nr:hypothetical protein [Alphaproteobacteria bacterium]
MKKFEYKIYQIPHIMLKKELDDLGSLGWCLVYYSQDEESIFKREINLATGKDPKILNDQFSDEITLETIKK